MPTLVKKIFAKLLKASRFPVSLSFETRKQMVKISLFQLKTEAFKTMHLTFFFSVGRYNQNTITTGERIPVRLVSSLTK